MAKMTVEDTSLTAVADAIRAKGETTEPLVFPDGFVSAIGEIKGGIDLTPYVSDTLTEVTEDMLAGCTYLCVAAFSVHKKLVKVSLPDTIKNMERETFLECSNLKEVKLPRGTTSLPPRMFQASGIETIDIPSNITSIEPYAFSQSKLTEVYIPDSVTSVGNDVFKNCYDLKSVRLSPNVQKINTGTFYACRSLTEIEIPSIVDYMWQEALAHCTSLKRVIMKPTTPPTIKYDLFNGTTPNEIVVPVGTLSAYQSATNWSAYADIMVEASV